MIIGSFSALFLSIEQSFTVNLNWLLTIALVAEHYQKLRSATSYFGASNGI